MIQHRRQQLFSPEKSTWQRGLEPDLCRLRYQCEDMERYLVVLRRFKCKHEMQSRNAIYFVMRSFDY